VETDNITIDDVSISSSLVQHNHLIYISQVRDLTLRALDVSSISLSDNLISNLSKPLFNNKKTLEFINVIYVALFEPWDTQRPRTMMYLIEGIRYVQGCMQLMEVNNILDLTGNNGHPIEIVMKNVTVQ
jgi:hypothetical protein